MLNFSRLARGYSAGQSFHRAIPAVLLLLAAAQESQAVTKSSYVTEVASKGGFALVQRKVAAPIFVDSADFPGVLRAANDLRTDIAGVTGGAAPALIQGATLPRGGVVLIGTLGKSPLIDRLAREKKLDVSSVAGKWEASVTQVVSNPIPGVSSALVIAGSDKRGTIFGIYNLSEQIGVSPWNWWADVPAKHHESLFVSAGKQVENEPAVKYRGIFLNDEEPALGNWARGKFGDLNSKFYTHVYELLLRLKANYLWPAMWGKSLTQADPESARLADEYGIVIGTSHHEPMMRAQQDWTPLRNKGEKWDYNINAPQLRDFWREGVRRNKNYETLTTIGMRGDGDEPMMPDENAATRLMETIVADQRKIIAEEVNPDVTKVPQLWALYKEVQTYYEKGMRVPDDVTLLWCDDNWGNIRRLPTAAERNRAGGAGIYYHFDYVGGPRSYKWLNTNSIPKVWEQMSLAHQYGADRIWIVNVGDLKPLELPIEFFLDFAREPKAWPKNEMPNYTRLWAQREFGPTYAAEIADIVDKYTRYNARRKPELIAPDTFSLVNYNEADRVSSEWKAITDRAEFIYKALPPQSRDAFFQLVLYPTKASAIVTQLYIAAGKNQIYAAQGRASANDYAAQVRALFAQDADLSRQYNEMNGGRWNHMMDQTHIGFTTWSDPPKNIMPAVREIAVPNQGALGVAVEGATEAFSPGSSAAKLPRFDRFNRQKIWVDAFTRGQNPLSYAVKTSAPWILVSTPSSADDKDQRLWVSVDWSKIPAGTQRGTVSIADASGTGAEPIIVNVEASTPTQTILGGFVESNGAVSIEAEHFTRKVDGQTAKWDVIVGHGRTLSSMAIFPANAKNTAPLQSVMPPQNAPRLEYQMNLAEAGRANVEAIIAPTLDFVPGRALRFAVSFDDQAPKIIEVPRQTDGAKWSDAVRDSVYSLRSAHTLATAGTHTLKIWMVDPGVVLQKIVVDMGGEKPSYLGPPESARAGGPILAPTMVTLAAQSAQMAQPARGPRNVAFSPNAPLYRAEAAIAAPRTDANSITAHQQLVEKAKKGGIDLYFLGDSITRRWGTSDTAWSQMLANWNQNFYGWNAGDFGWGADSIQNVLWRAQNGELDGVNPKVIVILAGTNNVGNRPGGDAKVADIVDGIRALVATGQQKAPDAKIILTGIFPRNDGANGGTEIWPEIQKINAGIAQLADQKRVFYVDVNDKLASPDGKLFEGMTVDNLHPSPKGYQVWADGLRPLLTQFLGARAATDHAPPPSADPSAAKPMKGP